MDGFVTCQSKRKKLSRQGRRARKPKRKTNNEQAASFLLCEKMLDPMMEILPTILGNRPPLQGQQRVSRRCPLYLCQWVALEGLAPSAANGEALTPNLTVGPRGASGQNALSNLSRGRAALILCIMVESAAVRNHKPSMGAKGGNQCFGKTDNGTETKMRMIVDGAETRPASPSQRAMSAIQRRPSV